MRGSLRGLVVRSARPVAVPKPRPHSGLTTSVAGVSISGFDHTLKIWEVFILRVVYTKVSILPDSESNFRSKCLVWTVQSVVPEALAKQTPWGYIA